MRGVPRWLAVLAVVAIVVVLGGFTIHRALAPAAISLEPVSAVVPADGFSTVKIKLHVSRSSALREMQVGVEDPRRATVESVAANGTTETITLRAGVLPGKTVIRFSGPGTEPAQFKLRTTLDASDSIGDGTPDFLRLHETSDRAAFRRWFTLLAESEYFRRQPSVEINDCAALLRYAYRETLRQHDATWAKTTALPLAPSAGDIRQYQYPYTPLGAGLFRVREGSFTPDDLNNGTFAQFADAKTLWRHNSYFVGRDVSRALPGDLLFFRQEGHDLPSHAMIYVGPSLIEGGVAPVVVYHTGPIGKSGGEIRRRTLAQLLNYPDPRWRPVASNPSFLGVYRWNILRGPD